jgi:hypothetical protein
VPAIVAKVPGTKGKLRPGSPATQAPTFSTAPTVREIWAAVVLAQGRDTPAARGVNHPALCHPSSLDSGKGWPVSGGWRTPSTPSSSRARRTSWTRGPPSVPMRPAVTQGPGQGERWTVNHAAETTGGGRGDSRTVDRVRSQGTRCKVCRLRPELRAHVDRALTGDESVDPPVRRASPAEIAAVLTRHGIPITGAGVATTPRRPPSPRADRRPPHRRRELDGSPGGG